MLKVVSIEKSVTDEQSLNIEVIIVHADVIRYFEIEAFAENDSIFEHPSNIDDILVALLV